MSTANTPLRNAAPFTLGEIAESTAGFLSGPADLQVRGVSTDTRQIEQGSLFLALRGKSFDGHAFLQQAQERGAAAVVIDGDAEAPPGLPFVRVANTTEALGFIARFHRRRFAIPVVGITGSYGKTTTRALAVAALSPRYQVLASTANHNNEIGVPLTLLQLNETHGAVVLEMAMRGLGEIAELARIAEPTIGVITNTGPQHIERLGSLENIARAKAELLEYLPQGGTAILPANDGCIDALSREVPPGVHLFTFGSDQSADFLVGNVETNRIGNVNFEFISSHAEQSQPLHLPLPGAHNSLNAAAALAVSVVLGVPLAAAAKALAVVEVPGSRMRILQAGAITIIDDSYNAGPDSMRAALETLRDFPAIGRRIAVLGSMRELGDWAEDEHRKIGTLSAGIVDELFGVGEETKMLLETAGRGWDNWFATADEAAPAVAAAVRSEDVVLIKGSRSIGLETVVNAIHG